MFEKILIFVAGVLVTAMIMSGGVERSYERGYNKATYETFIQCGNVVHELLKKECPVIYELLKDGVNNSREQEEKHKKTQQKENYEKRLLSHFNHYRPFGVNGWVAARSNWII